MHYLDVFGPRLRPFLRAALSYYVANGAVAALGLLLISSLLHICLGSAVASAASIGVIVCIPPDQASAKKGKFWHLLPALVVGLPLFFAVQALRSNSLWLGALLVPATFLAFLAGAWGKRGLPVVVSAMFAMVFSMAYPDSAGLQGALDNTLHFGLGAVLYLLYAPLANAALNARYRTQMLADTLHVLARLLRTQAQQFLYHAQADRRDGAPLIGELLHQQAALTDQLQNARDLLLESPNSPRRQQLAAILLAVLEMRDHLTACELDLDTLRVATANIAAVQNLSDVLLAIASDMDAVSDAYLFNLPMPVIADRRARLAALAWERGDAAPESAMHMLARGLANRVGNINDEAVRISALARGAVQPDIALIRVSWQMFVSATAWSWRPFWGIWRWKAPALRHAIRATLAIGFAYALALVLPWGTHDYWILLTIVVVLRGSLAQTLERRNSRVAGTLMGCLLVECILALHTPLLVMMLVITVAQAVAHALAMRRYLFTAIAATVLGLVQAHLINADASPVFDAVERIADTLIGVSIAWAFSYVMPSWERHHINQLVARARAAQDRYAHISLQLGQMQQMEIAPELAWRLARRECYEALSALVQATQRALFEPRAVRPPLEPLGRILALSYQLLAQLTSIKTMLLIRRDRLDGTEMGARLDEASRSIHAAFLGEPAAAMTAEAVNGDAAEPLPDPFAGDLTPWLTRRLGLACDTARKLASVSLAV